MHTYNIILASQSPRRSCLLKGLGLPFSVKVIQNIDESFPAGMAAYDVPEYLAVKKASAYHISKTDLLITADTLVMVDNVILGKPRSKMDARRMLNLLSGRRHQVVTGVCMKTMERSSHFSVSTEVEFKELTDREIAYYIDTYNPYDKAGAYGIQEWIGYIGVKSIEGSYYNVMGLPVQRIYQELINVYGVQIGAMNVKCSNFI